ncbi:hypothetical protein FOA52_010655 [Chlamydomonas sp. UWO 241]|nr:hypothetical protein FOA52_010655 [Chlamydomonas sp. UWO 241]
MISRTGRPDDGSHLVEGSTEQGGDDIFVAGERWVEMKDRIEEQAQERQEHMTALQSTMNLLVEKKKKQKVDYGGLDGAMRLVLPGATSGPWLERDLMHCRLSGAGLQHLHAKSDCLVNAAVKRMLEEGMDHSVLLGSIAAASHTILYTPFREVTNKLLDTFKTSPAALLSPLLLEAPHNRLNSSLAHMWHVEFPDVASKLAWPGASYAASLAEALLTSPQILPGGEAECALFFMELLATPGLTQATGTDAAWRQTAGKIFDFCMCVRRGTNLSDVRQLQSLVSLLQLAPAYDGVKVQAETYELTITAAAATQQPELCASIFELFVRACERNVWEPVRPALLEALVRTCDVGTIVEDSLGILSKPKQRSDATSMASLRPLVLDLSPSRRGAKLLLSEHLLLSTSPHLLLKMASLPPADGWPGWGRSLLSALQQVPFEQRAGALAAGGASALAQLLLHDIGGHTQPQLLVSFLEEHVATGVASSPGAAVDDSGEPGISAAPLASIQQADWRRLVSGMLDLCKGDQAITRATTRVVEMALAVSARPQAGGNVEARLVAETRWVVMEAMFAPRKLRHAAAVGVARDLLMGLQSRGWHLQASASLVQGAAAPDGAEAEVVPTRLAELVLEAVADLELWDLAESALAPEHLTDSSTSEVDGSSVEGRVAYYSGMEMKAADRQLMERRHPGSVIVWYESDDTGGKAPTQRLCKSIARGVYVRVYIDIRWSGHRSTGQVTRKCRQWRVPFQTLSPQVKSKLKAEARPQQQGEVAGALVARAATLTDSIADAGHSSDALAVVLAVVQAQTQQIASLVDLVHLLVSRVPGAPMQMPHAAHSAPRAAPAAKAAQPARPAAAAAPVASAAGAPAAERPAAAGAARAASARGPSRRGGLPARVGETSLCRSHVLSIPVAVATRLIAGHGSEGQVAAAAVRVAAAAVDGVSLPVCLAMNLVRFVHDVSGRDRPAGGGVVSASFLNAKPAVGGIGVEPRRGGVLRVLFTVASDAVADTVVRSRRNLRDVDPSAAVFDVLSDREEAQHRALWPAFLAAKAAGKRAQFHRARLVVDGERVPAPAC